jgi:hypothetical protein
MLRRGRRGFDTHFASALRIDHGYKTVNSVNEEVIDWRPLPLGELRGYVEPAAGGGEDRREAQVFASTNYNVTIFGFYPTITIQDRLIVNDSDVHNITAVSHDDTRTITMLATERIPPDESEDHS